METSCIFCQIIQEADPAKVPMLGDDYAIIKDIKPLADHHYLLVPRCHIPTINELTKADLPHLNLFPHLATRFLQTRLDEELDLSQMRLSYHVPPFNSVDHLHMHIIYPVKKLSWWQWLIYNTETRWSRSHHELLHTIQ